MSLTVRAQVVDIRTDTPTTADRFLVDTNVWYWLAYMRATQNPKPPQPYQTQHYPRYAKNALTNGATLHWCGLTYAELAHNIEKTEREIYAHQANHDIPTKEFRHDYQNQRLKVIKSVNDTWEDVVNMGLPLALEIDEGTTNAVKMTFPNVELDGYDLFMIEAMHHNGIDKIITDDGDYATVPGITIFTANERVIKVASASQKLMVR